MKNILILLTVLLLPTLAYAQSKSSFSSMEVNHVRVATPGLFPDFVTQKIRIL